MRKIEKEMLRAIDVRRNWKSGNTRVCAYDDGNIVILLHGNEIAAGYDGKLYINRHTLARWPTVTTRSRLNALGFNVTQKNFETYVDGVKL